MISQLEKEEEAIRQSSRDTIILITVKLVTKISIWDSEQEPYAYLIHKWVENSPVVVWRILGTGALEVLVDGILVVVVVEAVPHRTEHHVLPRHLERNTT